MSLGFDLVGIVNESSDLNFFFTEQLDHSSEDLMRMDEGRKTGAVQFNASSLEELSQQGESSFSVTHGVGSQFSINDLSSEVTTNHKWINKQINSHSEYREYETPTEASSTTLADVRAYSQASGQSLLGAPPAGSDLVMESIHTMNYFSPLADVTRTVSTWIEPYVSDGGVNSEPILFRYLEHVTVDFAAWVTTTGYVAAETTTTRSKTTFSEWDEGDVVNYRGLVQVTDPPSHENDYQGATRYEESRDWDDGEDYGITQLITITRPESDNTITTDQGTNTTVAPGGEHHTGTELLTTNRTIQKPLADFVGGFTTKTVYVSLPTTSSSNSGSNGGGDSQTEGEGVTEGTGGTQDENTPANDQPQVDRFLDELSLTLNLAKLSTQDIDALIEDGLVDVEGEFYIIHLPYFDKELGEWRTAKNLYYKQKHQPADPSATPIEVPARLLSRNNHLTIPDRLLFDLGKGMILSEGLSNGVEVMNIVVSFTPYLGSLDQIQQGNTTEGV